MKQRKSLCAVSAATSSRRSRRGSQPCIRWRFWSIIQPPDSASAVLCKSPLDFANWAMHVLTAELAAAFALILRLVAEGFVPATERWEQWQVVFAVLAALTRQRDAFGLFNIGSGEAVQVQDVVKKIIVASGRELSIAYDTAKPTVPTNIHLNCKRAAAALDWLPKVSLDEGFALTLEWYRDNIMNT